MFKVVLEYLLLSFDLLNLLIYSLHIEAGYLPYRLLYQFVDVLFGDRLAEKVLVLQHPVVYIL